MDPRISFSSDFVDTQQAINYKEAPASSDFEFSVKNNNLIPADEIFFKGMILPLKGNCTNQARKMTLRDELLVDDAEFVTSSLPKIPKKWRERFGLRKSSHQVVPNKGNRSNNNGALESGVEEKKFVFAHGNDVTTKKSY